MSRRTFIKWLLTSGGGALVVAGLGKTVVQTGAEVAGKIPPEAARYEPITDATTSILYKNGAQQEMVIDYRNFAAPLYELQQRLDTDNKTPGIMEFASGAKTTRLAGEVTDQHLQFLQVDSSQLHLYNNPYQGNDTIRVTSLDKGMMRYCLPVIVTLDDRGAVEINTRYNNESGAGGPRHFSQGYAVGEIETKGNKQHFTILGYSSGVGLLPVPQLPTP